MLTYRLICDRCQATFEGRHGEVGWELRRRSNKSGWLGGRKTHAIALAPSGIMFHPDGPLDYCPACVEAITKERRQ